MPQRNRDKLLQQSMYDMLMEMNTQLLRNQAEVTNENEIGEKEEEFACIMCTLMESQKAHDRCEHVYESSENDCGRCIAAWLNEFPF